MTLAELNTHINILEKTQKEIWKVDDLFHSTHITEITGKMFDGYIELLQKEMVDEHKWINYFIYETDFGRDGKEVKKDKDSKEITLKTVGQLYKLIK